MRYRASGSEMYREQTTRHQETQVATGKLFTADSKVVITKFKLRDFGQRTLVVPGLGVCC